MSIYPCSICRLYSEERYAASCGENDCDFIHDMCKECFPEFHEVCSCPYKWPPLAHLKNMTGDNKPRYECSICKLPTDNVYIAFCNGTCGVEHCICKECWSDVFNDACRCKCLPKTDLDSCRGECLKFEHNKKE